MQRGREFRRRTRTYQGGCSHSASRPGSVHSPSVFGSTCATFAECLAGCPTSLLMVTEMSVSVPPDVIAIIRVRLKLCGHLSGLMNVTCTSALLQLLCLCPDFGTTTPESSVGKVCVRSLESGIRHLVHRVYRQALYRRELRSSRVFSAAPYLHSELYTHLQEETLCCGHAWTISS